MKKLLYLFIAFWCATAHAQTIRTLGYNVSNNVLIGATNTNPLTFSNALAFSTNTLAAQTRTNLGLGQFAVATNLAISNVDSLQAALDAKLGTNGSAAALTNWPTFNQDTTGTASNVTGVVALTNGGTGANTAEGARANLELGSGNIPVFGGIIVRSGAFYPEIYYGYGGSNSSYTRLNFDFYSVDGGGLAKFASLSETNGLKFYGGNGQYYNPPFDPAGATRTNLGLPWTGLTNTNATGFQSELFAATTTNAPANTNAPTPDAWLDVQVGTNSYKLPLWQ